jgi:hypothetical protein
MEYFSHSEQNGTELITFAAALTQNLDKVQTLGIPVSVALVNVPGQK